MGLALVSFPCLAVAQARKATQPKRIGRLDLGHDPGAEVRAAQAKNPVWIEMRKKGWVLGETIVVERVYANGNRERLGKLAQEMVRKGVDVILAPGPDEVVAAARATRSIPILSVDSYFPIEQGLIDSYARPGRNVTGFAIFSELEMSHKRLEYLREVVPGAKRLAWLSLGGRTFSAETVSGGRYDAIPLRKVAAEALGFEPRFYTLSSSAETEGAFRELIAWRAQAIAVGGELFEPQHLVPELALCHRLPGAYGFSEHVDAGGLLSYAPLDTPDYDAIRYAEYLDHLLRGATPAELAVEGVDRYELVINMKTANALGLTVPKSLQLRADRIIR